MSYVRVTIFGSLYGAEVWSVNPTFDPSFEFPGGVDQTALDAAALAIANITPPTQLRECMGTQAKREGCRLEVRDDATDGLIGISIQASTTPVAGTATSVLPAQAAVVASLMTNTPGGRGRGRIYWPATGVQLATTGRISLPAPGVLVADFKTYFAAMDTALTTAFPTIAFDLAVRSKTSRTTPHVTRLRVGNVVDTQRRRRDALPESYSALAYP
jgi:hypothetical protein